MIAFVLVLLLTPGALAQAPTQAHSSAPPPRALTSQGQNPASVAPSPAGAAPSPASAAPGPAGAAPGPAGAAPQITPGAQLVADVPEIEIGQPVTWTLSVEHDAVASVRVLDSFALENPWVLVEAPSVLRGPDPSRTDRARTLVTFRALALEPGELAPKLVGIDLARGEERETLVPAALAVHVAGALGEGEDAPRALHGFRPIPDAAEHGPRWIAWAIVAGTIVAALIAFAITRLLRKRRKPAVVAPPTPLEQVAALSASLAGAPDDAQRSRAIVYELARLLRTSVDAFLGVERGALTDAEWSSALQSDERVPLGVRTTSQRLLARAETIKYALAAPTRFAVDEFLLDARTALEALASAPKPPAETPPGTQPAPPTSPTSKEAA